MSSEEDELPYGYQDDDVFSDFKEDDDSLSGYSSDDGGEFNTGESQAKTETIFVQQDGSTSEEAKEMEAYFQRQQMHGIPWNERFQSLVESAYFRKGEENYSAERQYELSIQLRQLCVEFATKASSIGVQIVKQMFLPIEERKIKPITKKVGGVAGGEKYLFKSIFFKFPVDSNDIYGGDFFANKTAEHELKGLMSAFDCRVEGLYVPLTALINYRGYSLIAQSWLPVDSNTIVYGTSDGGNTIHMKSKEFAVKMKEVGEQINLKPHDVWNRAKKYKKTLYGPADLEGHIGHDGRCYVLDCSRLFPPAAPSNDELKASFLYRLLRPEFVRKWKTPLSSDAFSKFGKDFESEVHNQEVREATTFLEGVEVPAFAKHLDQLRENKECKKGRGGGVFQERLSFVEELPQLVVDMRLRGINTRYLLLILTEVKHVYNRTLITTELIARHIKNQVSEKWRSLGKTTDWQDDTPYIRAVCDYFNSIFGSEHRDFWETLLHDIELEKFPLNNKSIHDAFTGDIYDWVEIPSLFLRLGDLLGLKFSFGSFSLSSEDVNYHLTKLFESKTPFQVEHIQTILPKIKYINRITFEEGTALSRLAMTSKDDHEAANLLECACLKYKESVAIRPNDTRALYNWGLSLSLLAGVCPPEHVQNYYNSAARKYKEALVLNPRDRRALFMWANMLSEQAKTAKSNHKMKMLEKACQLYNQSLELLPPGEKDFDVLYNSGVCYLTRANVIASNKEAKQTELYRLLSIASQRFTSAIEVQANSCNAIHNLAVTTAKRARTLDKLEEQQEEYRRAFHIYEQVSELDPHNPNVYFDWGNALFRCATSQQYQNAHASVECFPLLRDSFVKYHHALELDVRFDHAFINICLALSSFLNVASTSTENQKLIHISIDEFTSMFLSFFKNRDDTKGKVVEVALRTITAVFKSFRSFPEIIGKVKPCFEILHEPLPEKRSGSSVTQRHAMFQQDLKSSTNCNIPEPETERKEESRQERARTTSCPTVVPFSEEDSDVSLPKSHYKSPKERSKRGVLSRAWKLFKRKSKKDLDVSENIPIVIPKVVLVDLNWENQFLYCTIPSLELSELLVHQQVSVHSHYAIFLVHHTTVQVGVPAYYLMTVMQESHLERVSTKVITEHPCLLRVLAIFRAIERLYMLYELGVYPFLSYFRKEREHLMKYVVVYIAQLLLALEHIQAHEEIGATFKFSEERVYVDYHGALKVLCMVDWKKSDLGSTEELQQGLKYSKMLYSSPEQLRGERTKDDICWSFGIFVYQLLVGSDPYENERVESILKLQDADFEFRMPPFLDDNASDLLSKLLTIQKERRLVDMEQIKAHAFFAKVDWRVVTNLELPQPPVSVSYLSSLQPVVSAERAESRRNPLPDHTIREGQPLDTLIAPALKNDWAGFTLRQPNAT